eukprot:scaffold117955_cov99-Phaeocystis_antarctica.AAC.6
MLRRAVEREAGDPNTFPVYDRTIQPLDRFWFRLPLLVASCGTSMIVVLAASCMYSDIHRSSWKRKRWSRRQAASYQARNAAEGRSASSGSASRSAPCPHRTVSGLGGFLEYWTLHGKV